MGEAISSRLNPVKYGYTHIDNRRKGQAIPLKKTVKATVNLAFVEGKAPTLVGIYRESADYIVVADHAGKSLPHA